MIEHLTENIPEYSQDYADHVMFTSIVASIALNQSQVVRLLFILFADVMKLGTKAGDVPF